jgi:hypothetical protein
MNEREFDLYSVLSVTHSLPSLWAPFREILEYLSGQPVIAPSHSIGVRDACAEWLREQHPQLNEVPGPPDFADDESAMDAWAAAQATLLGVESLVCRPMPDERRQVIGSYIERLLDHVDPTKVWWT